MVPARPTPRAALLALALLACAGSGPASRPEPRAVPRYSIEEFLNTMGYTGASFAPGNGRILVSSDSTGIYNAFALPVDGSSPVQLTHSDSDAVLVRGYFPTDERFLYSSDQGGNELAHIYVRQLDGSVVDLTPGAGHRSEFYGWARDDASFYIGTNERDERFFDVYEYDPDTYDRTTVYRNEEGFYFAAIAPDRGLIALVRIRTRDDSDIYLYDTRTGETTHLTPHEGSVNHLPQCFSADGAALYLLTDAGSEFRYLVRHDLASGRRRVVERAAWDIRYASLSKAGRYLLLGINRDARTELRLYDAATMARVPLPEFPHGEISSATISRDEAHLAAYVSSSRMPRDLFHCELDGGQPRQLTRSLCHRIDPDHLVEGEVVRFASIDGVEIPGILYRPHPASGAAPVPAVVSVHGGPGGQSRLGYSSLTQYLVNHGYAVYAINNRGSSGYGKSFQQLDDRAHGEGDLEDCVASKQMLAATGYVDTSRVAILGGSYGGYMVLAALTFRPRAFAAGVDLFGISNWHRTVQNIPPWWEAFRQSLETEMGDFDDEEYFRSISPLFHAGNIVRPLMVLQGANDPRVLQVESDEIVEAARQNGVPVEYIVFDDEGHGFLKKENRVRGYREIRRFLDRHLEGRASGS